MSATMTLLSGESLIKAGDVYDETTLSFKFSGGTTGSVSIDEGEYQTIEDIVDALNTELSIVGEVVLGEDGYVSISRTSPWKPYVSEGDAAALHNLLWERLGFDTGGEYEYLVTQKASRRPATLLHFESARFIGQPERAVVTHQAVASRGGCVQIPLSNRKRRRLSVDNLSRQKTQAARCWLVQAINSEQIMLKTGSRESIWRLAPESLTGDGKVLRRTGTMSHLYRFDLILIETGGD